MPTREETSRELGNTEIDKRERQLGSQTRTQRHSGEIQRASYARNRRQIRDEGSENKAERMPSNRETEAVKKISVSPNPPGCGKLPKPVEEPALKYTTPGSLHSLRGPRLTPSLPGARPTHRTCPPRGALGLPG